MVGKNIATHRENLKISQRELGRRIGKTGQLISKIENNLTNPSMETLKEIANALNVPIDELIKDTNIVNWSKADEKTREVYTDFLTSDPKFPVILKIIESAGYELLQNTNNYDLSIIKDDSVIATIPEKVFIYLGKRMVDRIERFSKFEIDNIIHNFESYYKEEEDILKKLWTKSDE